jgi:hypothetical protein
MSSSADSGGAAITELTQGTRRHAYSSATLPENILASSGSKVAVHAVFCCHLLIWQTLLPGLYVFDSEMSCDLSGQV